MTPTAIPKQLYCSGCIRMRPLDGNWRALHVDSDGDLVMTTPERDGDAEYERPGTVFACGQGCSLVLVERYLHTRGFDAEHALRISAPGNTGTELISYLS